MQNHTSKQLEAQIDELFQRHTPIKSIQEAQEVIQRSLGSLPEPQKSEVAQALLYLWLSCHNDFDLKRKIGGIFCVHLGGGEFIPAGKTSKKSDYIHF